MEYAKHMKNQLMKGEAKMAKKNIDDPPHQ